MPAYSFNAQQYEPQYGGGGKQLPPGKYKGVIVDSRLENTKDGKGGMLVFDLAVIEGPLKDQVQTDRLNLLNANAITVAIANKQLSAYCYVTDVLMFTATEQLHNKPFLFEIGWQKGNEPVPGGMPDGSDKPGGFTEVKELRDLNGNPPGKAGSGHAPANPIAPPPEQPPAQVQPNTGTGGWGGSAPAAEQPKPAETVAPVATGGWGQQPQPQQPAGVGGWQQK